MKTKIYVTYIAQEECNWSFTSTILCSYGGEIRLESPGQPE